jgi:putative ABC transport system permease protein
LKGLLMASVRFYWRQPWQLLMCLLGVALGVAAVAAMNLAIDSSKRGFQLSNDAVFGATTHSLDAGQAGFDEQF